MRGFIIESDIPGNVAFITYESDVLGVIGHVLSLIAQLDPGENVVIECVEDN